MNSDQATFGEFVEESADPFDFDEYGPTMRRPIADVAASLVPTRLEALREEHGEAPYISPSGRYAADAENPQELEHFEEMMAEIHDDGETFDDEERGRIQHYAERDEIETLLRVIGIPHDTIENLIEAWGWETTAELLDHRGRWWNLEGIGEARAELLEAAEPIMLEAADMEPQDGDGDRYDHQLHVETAHAAQSLECPGCGEEYNELIRDEKIGGGTCPNCQDWIEYVHDRDRLETDGGEGDDARNTTRAVATDGGQPAEPDGCAAMTYDFDNLEEIPNGAVLSLDKHRGEYLVVNTKEVPLGTVQAIDVVDEQGNEYRLDVVALGGSRYFDLSLGHETAPVKMADNLEDVRDFEVLRRDQDWLEEYLAEKYPHFSR